MGSAQWLVVKVGRLLDRLDSIYSYSYEGAQKLDSEILWTLVRGLNGNAAFMSDAERKWDSTVMSVAASADGKLIIYSWDTRTGFGLGYSSVVQYRDDSGVHARVLFDAANYGFPVPGKYYDRIHVVKVDTNVYYLAEGAGKYDTWMASGVIKAFRIDARGLNDSVRLFREGKKLNNQVGIIYDIPKSDPYGDRPLARFDSAHQRLWIRHCVNRTLVKRSDEYLFDGRYFVYQEMGLEARVGRLLERLDSLSMTRGNYEVIVKANKQITSMMVRGLNGNDASMKDPFKRWDSAYMVIAGSADGKVRIYSWNAHTGGTMLAYSSVVQYRDIRGVHAKVMFDATSDDFPDEPGNWYDRIYSFRKGTSVYYLAEGTAKFDSRQLSAVVKAFRIDAGGLDDSVKLFREGKEFSNEVGVYYDLARSGDFMDGPERPMVRFDLANQRLLVRHCEDDSLYGRFDKYVFDGRYFAHHGPPVWPSAN